MEQVFEMKGKEKKKKLKDSETEVSGIAVQRSKVTQLGFTMSHEVFPRFCLFSALCKRWKDNALMGHVPMTRAVFGTLIG